MDPLIEKILFDAAISLAKDALAYAKGDQSAAAQTLDSIRATLRETTVAGWQAVADKKFGTE